MKSSDLRQWAMVGAQQRLAEIANEQNAIFAAFPELRGNGRTVGPVVESRPPQGQRRRFRMSADARKRISDAQKARWAKQRAEDSGQSTSSAKSTSRKKK
jgi:hypothetical protein